MMLGGCENDQELSVVVQHWWTNLLLMNLLDFLFHIWYYLLT